MGRNVVVYVDGFNLYFGLRESGLRRFYWLDIEALAQTMLLPDQQLVIVRYFTADLRGTSGKRKRSR